MGYTHYFKQIKQVPEDLWDEVLDAVNDICNASDVPLDDGRERDADGFTTEKFIHLNGVGEDSHETFYIDNISLGFNFCKTSYKPYDKVVTAILCAIDQICGACFEFSSDGDAADWVEGLNLANSALKRTINIPASI